MNVCWLILTTALIVQNQDDCPEFNIPPVVQPPSPTAPDGRYRLEDCYYSNERGQKFGLALTDKIYLRFIDNPSEAKKAAIFAKFQKSVDMVSVEKFQDGNYAVQLVIPREYAVNPGVKTLMVVNLMSQGTPSEDELIVLPVFLLGDQEVTLTQKIEIKTKPAIDLIHLKQRLSDTKNPLGQFEMKELVIVPNQPRTYVLEVSNLQWPSNILVLANLINDQPWVENASPVFHFLHLPISMTMTVFPSGAPSLGERRVLSLEIVINDANIKLKTDDLPQLGDGEFVFMGLDEPFFKAEKAAKNVEKINASKEVWKINWPFYAYVAGDFTLKPVAIPFVVESDYNVSLPVTTPTKVFTTSVIGSAQPPVTDIQSIKRLSRQESLTSLVHVTTIDETTKFWLIVQQVGGAITLVAGLILAGYWLRLLLCERMRRRASERSLKDQLQPLMENLRTAFADVINQIYSPFIYESFEMALRQVLEPLFGLADNVTIDDLRGKAINDDAALVRVALKELQRRHDKGYRPAKDSLSIFSQLYVAAVRLMKEKING